MHIYKLYQIRQQQKREFQTILDNISPMVLINSIYVLEKKRQKKFKKEKLKKNTINVLLYLM